LSDIVSVPVMLDDPHPEGSTGMTEAILALTYDPSVLSVSAADIRAGTIPALGSGWHLNAVVDQATGQIGIELFSTTPITTAQAGSLVTIGFHVRGDQDGVRLAWLEAPAVQVVTSITVNGQTFITQVADDQGQFTLTPGSDSLAAESLYKKLHPQLIARRFVVA
jgi:hypothetical protein